MSSLSRNIVRVIQFFLLAVLTVNTCFSRPASNESSTDTLMIISLIDSSEVEDLSLKEALQYANKAKEISEQSDCNGCLAESLFAVGRVFYYYSVMDSSLIYFKDALQLFEANNDTPNIFNVYNYIVQSYRSIPDYDNAINSANLGLYFADSLKLQKEKANFYLLLGNTSLDAGLDKEAADALMKALVLFENDNDSIGMCSPLVNLGLIFANDSNFTNAFYYTNRALNICSNSNDNYGISVCLTNLGDFNLSLHKYDSALIFFKKSLAIDTKFGSDEDVAVCFFNIGESYKGLRDTTLAISYYTECIRISNKNNFSARGVAYTRLGELLLAQGNLKKALKHAKDGLKIAKLSQSIPNIIDSYNLLHKCSAEMGNYENAYNYFALCKKFQDSIYSIDKSKSIQEIISVYNDKQQKNEISKLVEKSKKDSTYTLFLSSTLIVILATLIVLLVVSYLNNKSKISLKNQKQYFEKLLERSEDFIFVVGKDGLTSYISPSYQRKIGRVVNERVGKDSFEFIHPEDVANVKQEFNKLTMDKVPRTLEFRMQDVYGKWIDVSTYGQNLFEDPIINGIIVNFRDITEQRKNEQTIVENGAKFRKIFNAFPDIYFEAEMSGIITEVSPSVVKITGLSREDIIGTNSKKYYRYIRDWKSIGEKLETEYSVHDFDTEIVKKNGDYMYCSLTAEIIFSSIGTPIGVKGVIRDISNRVKSQEKLRESEKKLKEANKAKERIFSIISHDLINSIGTNKSIVDLIVDNIEQLPHEEIISLITELKPSLDSTFSLIENLLSWSRIQQHSLKPNFENISISELVQNMVSILSYQAKRKFITLSVINDEPLNAFCDKNQVDIALRNLVSNAIKFSSANDKVIISIDKAEEMTQIKIVDSGIGMTEDQLSDILDGGGSTTVRRGTSNEKGTGFGLVIVNEFIKGNNGSLDVHSKEGKGTSFIVLLPTSQA